MLQLLNRPFTNCQSPEKLCQSGKISPFLVTLRTTLLHYILLLLESSFFAKKVGKQNSRSKIRLLYLNWKIIVPTRLGK